MTEKVELLAPAGNYESFLGAIHAGADAVYLGGEKFGARAFADNFTTEKLCQAIRYAHLWEKKIYLTVNTLVKENEFSEIYDYLKPFYEEGLDGVIVQDIGVFEYIKEQFPDMELHVSTQMTITGRYGAKLLKEMGAKRIVPARELSLTEIIKLKEETGLELETFIHGAMCYCYSGQCLFSSIVGGRSGNRGKCAQPCRLPYQVFENDKELTKGECYPLSLKDMCTIQNIPEFIEAGIHSFKIEGRMKKPEYVAGVTAIYRKYIDLYYQKSKNSYQVSTQDMQKLSSLYIRSEIQDGYYHKHNGKDMVTLTKPGYSASDETLLAQIRTNYLENSPKLPISIALTAKLNKPLCLTIQFKDRYVSVEKGMVEAATKQPITSQNIEKQLLKLGETCFKATACQIDMDDFIFVSLKVLNELRREGILALEDAILKHRKSTLSKEKPLLRVDSYVAKKGLLYVSVRSKEQFEAIFPFSPYIDRLYIDIDLMLENSVILQKLDEREDITLDVYASLPFILRLSDDKYLKDYTSILLSNKLQGCLVKNLEEIQYLKDINFQGKIALDAGLYAFNQKATNTLAQMADSICLPYELNRHEKNKLTFHHFEQVVYGRIPMMISANCVRKTASSCSKANTPVYILDRYKNEFPVSTECTHCYNIIWNSVPLSLHNTILNIAESVEGLRMQFSIESADETQKIMSYYLAIMKKTKNEISLPFKDYTTGHEKRGVE